MENLTETTRAEKIRNFIGELNSEIDILYCIDASIVDSFEDIEQAIEDNNGFDIEIIYYYNAIKYLSEHDSSLAESMSLASELGYSCENVNSELLASLLASQNARAEFYELQSEIEAFFEELEETEE